LAGLSFPEPVKVEEPVAEVVEETTIKVEEAPLPEKQVERKKEAKKAAEEEEEDTEHAKDGVSLDELFQMKPEMFQSAANEDDELSDKKKGKKTKKKGVALEFDEDLGEVVSRKKHKRGGDDADGADEDW
jgi:hypothetical protein